MNLRDGVVGVRNRLGEGSPWLFNNNDIIRDLNISARAMCSFAQALRGTYPGVTHLNPVTNVYDQEYPMPQDCEFPYEGKIQIGILYPLSFHPQGSLQQGGFAASAPFAGYWRRGITLTQQTGDGGENVLPPADRTGLASWILGLYPVPSGLFKFFIDYVQYHPQMSQPMDAVLIPEAGTDIVNFADAWTAYATARGKEKEGDLDGAAYYDTIHSKGKLAFRDYMLAIQAQVTPPIYGGDQGLFGNGPQVAIMAPTASNLSIQ